MRVGGLNAGKASCGIFIDDLVLLSSPRMIWRDRLRASSSLPLSLSLSLSLPSVCATALERFEQKSDECSSNLANERFNGYHLMLKKPTILARLVYGPATSMPRMEALKRRKSRRSTRRSTNNRGGVTSVNQGNGHAQGDETKGGGGGGGDGKSGSI